MHLSGYAKFKSDIVKAGDLIGYSGGETESYVKNYSSGPHVHIQAKRDGVVQRLIEKDGVIIVNQLTTIKDVIDNRIDNQLTTDGTGGTKELVKSINVYMTHYDLTAGQTDASPCTGASGKNICKLHEQGINVIALTSDQRKKMGIKWGDKVQIVGKTFNVVAQVEDEMNIRFRTRCIKKQGLCIKADWATPKGKEGLSGPVTITKI